MFRGSATAARRPWTASWSWITTLVLALLVQCSAHADSATQARDAELAAVSLHVRKAATLLEDYAPSFLRDAEARRELERASRRVDRAGTLPPPMPGLVEEAYISVIDGSAQPFYRYLPRVWKPAQLDAPALPLLVYLHGYWSTLDLVNWAIFPDALTNLAETVGVCVAIPFGRSNTDFQGIGEQDVLHVVELMHARYGIDTNRVVLAGHSMGGMGAWTIGTRFAERFNGLLILSGRGDYDNWHRLEPGALPPWEREIVDAQFLGKRAPRLGSMPILAYHGALDTVVLPEEAEAAFRLVRAANPEAKLVMLPEADHWFSEEVLARPDCADWLRSATERGRTGRPTAIGVQPGEVPSALQNAFLTSFLFVQASSASEAADAAFARRCAEWKAFAKAQPRTRREADLTEEDLRRYNLFLFGEPQDSPLVRHVFAAHRVGATETAWDLQGRKVQRADRGLWLALPSPFAADRTVVVNHGVPWGEALAPNHRYDMLPDLLVYTREPGRLGINVPVCAARVAKDGRFVWWDAEGRPDR